MFRQPRWLIGGLIAAAGLYVFGAVGLEAIGSRVEYLVAGFEYNGTEHYSLNFELIAVAEETFEYAGMLLTLALFIRRARELGASLTLGFSAAGRPAATD